MAKHHHRGTGIGPAAHPVVTGRRGLLGSCVALSMSTTGHAQQAQVEDVELDAVLVAGIRGAVHRAQDIKRDAETFVDAVTALDIGALPDRSVTETLSRIPG